MIYPWENINHRTLRKSYLNSSIIIGLQTGCIQNKKLKYIEDRMTSYDAAKSHILQFKNLINKIKQHGYIENHDDYPTAVILIKDNKWKWMMSSSGNHRSHIKKELNFDFINCKIIGIVNLTDVKNYNNVRNGTFNEEEASILFENAFEGKIPIEGPLIFKIMKIIHINYSNNGAGAPNAVKRLHESLLVNGLILKFLLIINMGSIIG